MTGSVDFWLYLLQRVTAIILAPLVFSHLALIIVAAQGGLGAAEILSRTRGSPGFVLFYGLFVVVASIHGAIGLRNVLDEFLGWRSWKHDLLIVSGSAVLLALGLRAVLALS